MGVRVEELKGDDGAIRAPRPTDSPDKKDEAASSYWAADVNARKGECRVHVGSKQFEVVPGWQRRWADE